MTVLDAQRLYRFFHTDDEEVLALQGVSVDADPGQIIAVTGPSGSGKSTLLACLAGLDDPDGGTVTVAGQRLSRRPEPVRARLRARQIGVLFQADNLLDHLTVRDNIRLAQSLAATARPTHPTALLDAVGLTHRTHAYPDQLSGGERARAGLAVALANDPAVLLADEPTGELDEDTEQRIIDLLQTLTRQDVAVVVATHSPKVADHADRIVALRDGQVVQP